MKEIDDLFERIDAQDDIDGIRSDIASLIKTLINEDRDNISDWKKSHLMTAISSLSSNMSPPLSSSDIWLRLCLFNIEKSLVSTHQRDDSSLSNLNELNDISVGDLINAIDSLFQNT